MNFDNHEDLDLYCSLYVQSSLQHREFVSHVAATLAASTFGNIVENNVLDISVYDNDDYDPAHCTSGKDRWLHFRYRLEIDPNNQVDAHTYKVTISILLSKLWSAGMDAVAACDFEDELPQNIRRSRWQ